VEETVSQSRAPGRRCRYPGCVTVLSVYNFGVLCWSHADEKARNRFDRRSAASTAERLEFVPRKDLR
jgi:hypothetical protein